MLVWFCVNAASTFGSDPAYPDNLVGLTQSCLFFFLHNYETTAIGLLNATSVLQ